MTTRATFYERFVRPVLFRLDPETAHRLGQLALTSEWPWSMVRPPQGMERLCVQVGPWTLGSPLGLAAGFDKNGDAVAGLQHLGFDYLIIGSILTSPGDGNPRPRMIRYPAQEALVNCYGLPTQGVDACVLKLKRLALQRLRTRLIANIHGETVDDYRRCFAAVEPYADGVELGLRCPNRSDPLALLPTEDFDHLIGSLRDMWPDKPIFAKLPPFTNEREKANRLDLIEHAIAFNLTGVSIPGNRTVVEPRLSRGQGSLSGRPTFAHNLESVKAAASVARGRIAIKANGGVHTGAEALALIDAGASMIDILTAFVFRGWNVANLIKTEMLEAMRQRAAIMTDAPVVVPARKLG